MTVLRSGSTTSPVAFFLRRKPEAAGRGHQWLTHVQFWHKDTCAASSSSGPSGCRPLERPFENSGPPSRAENRKGERTNQRDVRGSGGSPRPQRPKRPAKIGRASCRERV